jgi:hypothetical protein
MKTKLLKTICYAIAVAMGVAVIVTNIVSPLSTTSLGSLLAIAVIGLGLAGLQK